MTNSKSDKRINDASGRKITMMQFVGCILVLLVHSSGAKHFTVSAGVENIICYLTDSLPFSCVSIFAFLSGFLMFKDSDEKALNFSYKSKLLNRAKTILVPYLIWNTLNTVFVVVMNVVPALHSIAENFAGEMPSFLDMLNGVFFYKYSNNWYLFYLMKYIVFSPLIYLCLKNKKLGLVFLAAVFVYCGLNVDWLPFFISSDSSYNLLMMFCLGAYIAIHGFGLINKSFSKKQISVAFVSVILTTIAYYLIKSFSVSGYVKGYTYELLRIVFVLSLWVVCDIFKNRKTTWWSKCSFFIYQMHGVMLLVISKLFIIAYNYFGLNQSLGALLNVLLVSFITLFVILFIAFVMKKWFKKLWSLLNGSRG